MTRRLKRTWQVMGENKDKDKPDRREGEVRSPKLRSPLRVETPVFLIGGLHLAKVPSPPLLIPCRSWVFNF